jgi:hypothetical protein
MIKVQNNTATREPIPAFLRGLQPESLADLSWTDPQLGVADAAWWPEVDQSTALEQFQKYGDETLTIDASNKQVIVVRAVVPMDQAEVDAMTAAKAAEVRAERNAKLSVTDWRFRSDMNPSQAWKDYCQALRDITAQAGFPWDVQWPDMPA